MTNKTKVILGVAIVAILVVGVAISQKSAVAPLGGTVEYQKKSFVEGLFAGTGRQVNIDRDGNISTAGDLTVSGRDLIVTTSNTATSTITVGCIQMYATSTATAGRLYLSTASTTGATGGQFIPVWEYGTCPR